MIDGTAEDIARDYHTLVKELAAYGGGLAEKRRIVALNKADAVGDDAELLVDLLAAEGVPVDFVISGVTGHGLPPLLRELRKQIENARMASEPVEEATEWKP